MGAEPWHCFTSYQADINAALQHLREHEFRLGRYGSSYSDQIKLPAEQLIEFHGSIQAAMQAVIDSYEEVGTSSILDISRISSGPEMEAACPLPVQELEDIFQTTEPTHQLIESTLLNEDGIEDWGPWDRFWESIGRGEGRYIIVYVDGEPTEIFFAGYSFD